MPRKYSGPLQPGRRSAYVPGVRKNAKRNNYRASAPLRSIIKKVALSQSETKNNRVAATNVSLFHNQTHYVANLLNTTQGVTASPADNSNRIGNEVIARGLSLKIQYITDPTKPNFNVRGFVFKYESEEPLSDANFWVGANGVGSSMNRMLDITDSRKVTIVKSFMITSGGKVQYNVTGESSSDDKVANFYKNIWIPLKNKKIKYDGNGSEHPKFVTYGFATVSYDANNTFTTDINCYLSMESRFYFKDP